MPTESTATLSTIMAGLVPAICILALDVGVVIAPTGLA